MSAMSEDEIGHDETSFWDDVDQSWPFPSIATETHENPAGPSRNSDLRSTKGGGDAPLPPPTGDGRKRKAAGKEMGENGEKGKAGGGDQSEEHELHIWTERERRKKMRNMFENLHALIPHLAPKADKSTIVDEAVSYIKTLEHTLHTLQKQKLERLHGIITNTNSPPIARHNLSISSREAFLAEHAGPASNPNPLFVGPDYEFSSIFKTWVSPNVILNVCGKDAQMSICSLKKAGLLSKICLVMDKNKLEMVSAHISSNCYRCMYMIHARPATGSSDQYQPAFGVEEMYKQAAAEIMLWVNS